MQTNDDREILSTSLIGVLEQMAFVFAEEDSGLEEYESPEEALSAQMGFKGAHNGGISLSAPLDLCREIAVNMLGAEPDGLSDGMLRDALREVLNMACGQFLTQRYGSDLVFDLTVPEVTVLDRAAWDEIGANEAIIRFAAEDQPLFVVLDID